MFYLLQDHLHSSSATVAQNGVLAGSRNYFYPFGGNRGGASFNALTAKRFTGQYHEAAIPGGEGLSYYNARWYDAQLGRFTTPDSIIPKPDNPQDFNRYAYVRNNPLKYVDPSGHLSLDAIWKYFGFRPNERALMAKKWGKGVTDFLWNNDTSWGAVMNYVGGSAVLMLFEDSKTGKFVGGFWGLSGNDRGTRVTEADVRTADSVTLGSNIAKGLLDGTYNLPNRLNSLYRYDYYLREYKQIGLLHWVDAAAAGVEVAPRAAQVAAKVITWKPVQSLASVKLPTWYTTVVTSLTIYVAGGELFEWTTGYSLPGINSLGESYPIMSPWQPYGTGPHRFSQQAPPGFYE